MNRKERRALGFTEPRYRKTDLERNRWYDDAFVSHHAFEAFKLGNTTEQRKDRLNGKPRRWQVEKARRIMEKM